MVLGHGERMYGIIEVQPRTELASKIVADTRQLFHEIKHFVGVQVFVAAAQVVVDGDSREFYEEAAAAAASLAVCIDLYVASPAAVGLRCLEPLAVSSGGVVYLYPSLEESALPQVPRQC